MNYTREPIIESVITPREGCKIVLRNCKRQEHEDYLVDAVEVVSFGSAIFFRSLERPKPFLLPVTDFEILEVKETKMVLKAVSPERSIKIGGGKVPNKPKTPPFVEGPSAQETPKKGIKRKSRRKRTAIPVSSENSTELNPTETKGGDKKDEAKVSSSVVRGLLPPPTILIKEKLDRIKNEEISKQASLEKQVESKPQEKIPSEKKEENS